ncbi:MAG: hypothetical protein KatS3mg008_1729 [Acidimicrobiales bacterium]|nr:MAG: hypothetical protein KatS3mg008_1729 [Acidimicrobiales bacterium]
MKLDAVEEQLRCILEGELRAGFGTAAQAFVAVEGQIICDIAVGERIPGSPVGVDTLFNLHCATKPVVAVAVAAALERAQLAPSMRVAQLLDVDHPSPITVRDLVSHTAGLDEPDAFSCYVKDPADLEIELNPVSLLDATEVGVPAYSEVAAWHLLAEVLRTLTGRDAATHLTEELESLRLADSIWFEAQATSTSKHASFSDRIGCYFDTNTGLPLLHDLVERFWGRSLNISVGTYASISGLGRWYLALLETLNGARLPAMPSSDYLRMWLSQDRGRMFDRKLLRKCSFAGGFMTGLRDHNFGTAPSTTAFGHSGFLGNSFVLAEPETGTVIGCLRGGIGADPVQNVNVMRPLYVAEIYNLLGQ